MPLQVTCEHCGKQGQVKEELAGKRVKCPKCGDPVQVPVLAVDEDDRSNEGDRKAPKFRGYTRQLTLAAAGLSLLIFLYFSWSSKPQDRILGRWERVRQNIEYDNKFNNMSIQVRNFDKNGTLWNTFLADIGKESAKFDQNYKFVDENHIEIYDKAMRIRYNIGFHWGRLTLTPVGGSEETYTSGHLPGPLAIALALALALGVGVLLCSALVFQVWRRHRTIGRGEPE